MLEFESQELRDWCDGEWIKALAGDCVRGFSFDTRTLNAGEMFVALKTPKRDGHEFLQAAKDKGAAAALVSSAHPAVDLPQLLVEDSLVGFGNLARGYRESASATMVGVTGSCGKTTFKDLLSCLLGGKPGAWSTEGNLNNRIGVPATILAMPIRECRFAVVEAGISERGEMEHLATIIDPDVVVFTSIGPAHLEGLGSLEGVASEKGRLASKNRTRRVYMSESCQPFKDRLAGGFEYEIVAEGIDEKGARKFTHTVVGDYTRISIEGMDREFEVRGGGSGLASNVAMALIAASDLGVDAAELEGRLRHWRPGEMRGEWKSIGSARVYLDCYNANPQSMLDALETFDRLSDGTANRVFALGSMEELGDCSSEWHRRVGSSVTMRSGDLAVLIGDGAEAMKQGLESNGDRGRIEWISKIEEIQPILSGFSGDVFVKGSRRHGLEKVVSYIAQSVETEKISC